MVASRQSGLPETTSMSLHCSRLLSIVLTACRLEQWVSVKIIIADRTNQSRELHNLRALAEHSKGGSEHIVQLLDDFLHEGPNGCHQCLVFELLGPTVSIYVDDYHGMGRVSIQKLFSKYRHSCCKLLPSCIRPAMHMEV